MNICHLYRFILCFCCYVRMYAFIAVNGLFNSDQSFITSVWVHAEIRKQYLSTECQLRSVVFQQCGRYVVICKYQHVIWLILVLYLCSSLHL
jgi:hypothetical protein